MQKFKSHDGLEVAYYVDDFTKPWERADTVVLLHAAMGNAKRWFRWVPPLTQKYRVVRMELRGHGESQRPTPDQPFSLDLLVKDVLTLIDHLELDTVHLVGNSAGGYVTQKLAIGHGDRLKTISLFGSTPGLKHSQAMSWIPRIQSIGLKKFLADTIEDRFDKNADPGLVRWFIEQAGSCDPAFTARFVSHMCTHDFMDELSEIRCPTLIVAAARESIGQADTYGEMHKRIANSRLLRYDTAAHNICDGYADQCVADLQKFLSDHEH